MKLLAGATCLMAAASTMAAALPQLVEVETDVTQVPVNSQLVYRLRFLQSMDVRNIRITGPVARLAEVRPLGPIRHYEMDRAGARYRVHEVRFAVFPFASGRLELVGAGITGRYPGDKQMSLTAPARAVMVEPARASSGGGAHWLPARMVRLSEQPAPPGNKLRAGDSFARTLVIEAAGVDASVLPPLLTDGPDFHVDADSPRLSNHFAGELNVARREQTFRYTPLTSGTLSLPDVRVPWWSVSDNRWEMANLPGRAVFVEDSRQPSISDDQVVGWNGGGHDLFLAPFWRWLAGLGVATGFVTLVLLFVRDSGLRALRTWRGRRSVVAACHEDNPSRARDALLLWARQDWPDDPPRTVGALAARLGDYPLQQALADLERQLYGSPPRRARAWAGDKLVAALPFGMRLRDSGVSRRDR